MFTYKKEIIFEKSKLSRTKQAYRNRIIAYINMLSGDHTKEIEMLDSLETKNQYIKFFIDRYGKQQFKIHIKLI